MPSWVCASGRNTASVACACTAGRASRGQATITRPAPTRAAARAISAGAPVMRRDPATTRRTPELRLCPSIERIGRADATSIGSTRPIPGSSRSSGDPMSTTRTVPERSAPGSSTEPTFAAPNATVRSAQTAEPSTAPVRPSTPEGMSAATTGARAALSASIASSQTPSGSPRKPVPKSASTATSARASDRSSRDASHSRAASPCSASRARFVPAAWEPVAAASTMTMSTRMPSRARCRAATNPSPPLLPFPHTTTARRP